MSGWIKLHRQLCNNPLWLAEKFTRSQAWIDLILNANHNNGFFMVRGNRVNVKRGQTGWSEITMATRWKWSRTKVRNFLKSLEKEQQIEQQKTPVTSIVTILNYEKYQSEEQQTEQQTIQQKDNRKTTEEQQKNTNKNVKKNKNVKNNKKPLSEKISDEHIRLAEFLRKWILKNKPDAKVPDDESLKGPKGWANDFRMMMETDNRTVEEIKTIIEFCQKDTFWLSNILSAGKLRDKFDQLYLRMQEKKNDYKDKANKDQQVNSARRNLDYLVE